MSETVEEDRVEEVTDLDDEPTCQGLTLVWRTGRKTHLTCDEVATWQKTVRHCGVRSKLMCDDHTALDKSLIRQSCAVCGTAPIEASWRQI